MSQLIAVAKYSNNAALKQGRTESLQWRLWQPLYGPCVTLEHSYSQLESAVCWFLVREENRRTRRKTLEAEKRTNTNSAHLWRRVWESNPGHIGGRRALSPLHHPCFPKYMVYEVYGYGMSGDIRPGQVAALKTRGSGAIQ